MQPPDMVSPSARLRVGVADRYRHIPSTEGWGRMWRSVLPELAELVSLGYWEDPRRSRFRQPPDVWLHDGHHGPLGVPEPVVIHLQEASWRDPSTRPLLTPAFIEHFERSSRAAAESSARVLTPSVSSQRQIVEQYGLDPSHVHVVPFGVDLALFRPGRPGAGNILARAGGDPTRPYVLFVSTVHPRKNLPALRAAMAALAARGLPHGLVVVGAPPPDREDATALFAEAGSDLAGAPGRVVLLQGLTDVELAAVMAGASAFCQPSLMEGFGLTALEAMACGVPVVVSNRGSLPEVVGDAGVVSEPDAESLEKSLYDVLTDPERSARLGRDGLERCLRFTWRATAEGWRQALHETVPSPRASALARLAPDTGATAQLMEYGIRIPVRRRSSASRHQA